MTTAEFKQQLLQVPTAISTFSEGRNAEAIPNTDIPDSWDMRIAHPDCVSAKKIVDQGTCGSCWAWAASGVLSNRLCIASKGKINIPLSPQWLLDCDTKGPNANGGCGGGALDNVWGWLTTPANGISAAKCDPYTEGFASVVKHLRNADKCTTGTCSDGSKGKLYHAFKPWSPQSDAATPAFVKEVQELMTNGPVEVGVSIMGDFGSYKKGVYHLAQNSSSSGGHAVQIIGWGTGTAAEKNTPYWLVQNSWGAKWGEKGYVRVRRGTNEIGIEQEVVAGLPQLS